MRPLRDRVSLAARNVHTWAYTQAAALVAGGSYGCATRDYRDNLNANNNASKNFDWFAPRVGLLWQSEDGLQVYGTSPVRRTTRNQVR